MKDYAGRKPPHRSNRRKTRTKTKPEHRSSNVPWLAIALSLVIFSGLGWLLTSSSGEAERSLPPQVVQPEPEQLPEKPNENDFIKLLEAKDVIVDIPEKTEPTRPYQMQCASFRNRSDAESMKAKIAFAGLSADVRSAKGDSGTWHKVVLGPYPRKRLAEKDRHKLQRINITTCQIWFWTDPSA